MRLVEINKRLYAAGLKWYQIPPQKKVTLATLRASIRKEAESMGDNEASDMAALRPRQYGFGMAGTGDAYKKAVPLAGGVVRPGVNFLGVFRLRDTQGESFWWVIAVRQGLISSLADCICSTREEADKAVLELRDLLGEFDEQQDCETPEASLAWLEPVVRYHAKARLHALRVPPSYWRNRVLAACGIALVIAGAFAGNAYLQHREEQRRLTSLTLSRRQEQQRREYMQAHPEQHFAQPWRTSPPVTELAAYCGEKLLELPTAASGWKLERATCSGSMLTVEWQFQPGADFMRLPPYASLESTRKAVSHIWQQPAFSPREAETHDALPSQTEIRSHLYQLTQNMGALLNNFQFDKPEQKVIEKIAVLAPWQKGKWELKSIPAALLLDESLGRALSLPGLILREIVFSSSEGWTMRGDVYAAADAKL